MTAQILRDGASWRRHQIGARGWRKLEKCVLQSTVDLQFGQIDNGGVPVEIEDRQSFDQEAFLVNRQDHALEGEILSFRGKVQEMLPTFTGSRVEDLSDSKISPEAANPKEDPDGPRAEGAAHVLRHRLPFQRAMAPEGLAVDEEQPGFRTVVLPSHLPGPLEEQTA